MPDFITDHNNDQTNNQQSGNSPPGVHARIPHAIVPAKPTRILEINVNRNKGVSIVW